MANRKISDLAALTTPASGDYLPIVDVSEAAAADKNKRITVEELMRGVPDGTAGAPGIAFESDGGNGFYLAGTDTIGVSTNGVNRLTLSTSALTSTVPISASGFIPTSSTVPTNGVYLPAANSVALSTNGTGRLFVDASGNVGVNTATPFSSSGKNIEVVDGNVARLMATNSSVNGRRYAWYSGTSGQFSLYDYTGNSERLTVTSAGLVGIGTSSPTHNLTIGNTAASDFVLALRGGVGGFLGWDDSANCTILQAPNTRSLQFRVNSDTFSAGTMAMHINSSGNVGIGTTSPETILHVSANVNNSSDYYLNGGATALIRNDNASGVTSLKFSSSGNSTSALVWGGTGSETLIFTNRQKERARIDSSGRLLVGTSSGNGLFNGGTQNPQFQIEGTTGNTILASLTANRNDAAGPTFYLAHSRGTAAGGTTVLQSGDQCGILAFAGTDGTDYVNAATITAQVDGTPGANDMPGRLVFSSTPSGSASPVERLRITSAGVLQVADAGNIAVGTTTGTKIGTATTQKLGFFNATPVVQPAAVADATDAATVITQLNDLLAKLRTLGIIAT